VVFFPSCLYLVSDPNVDGQTIVLFNLLTMSWPYLQVINMRKIWYSLGMGEKAGTETESGKYKYQSEYSNIYCRIRLLLDSNVVGLKYQSPIQVSIHVIS
jgi:hypothetical protein